MLIKKAESDGQDEIKQFLLEMSEYANYVLVVGDDAGVVAIAFGVVGVEQILGSKILKAHTVDFYATVLEPVRGMLQHHARARSGGRAT